MQRNFLVVAQSAKLREEISGKLRKRGFTVTLASTGGEAIQVVRHVQVDIVLIESRRPDARVKRLRSRLLKERPGVRVFVVTNFEQVRNSSDLLRFGTHDYILGTEELLELASAQLDAARGPARHQPERAHDRWVVPPVARCQDEGWDNVSVAARHQFFESFVLLR